MKMLVIQLCSIFVTPWISGPLGSSVHRISQARILKLVAMSSSRRSSWYGNWTWISCFSWHCRWILLCWAIKGSPYIYIYTQTYTIFQILLHLGYYKILNTVPCSLQVFVVYLFYSSVYLLIPTPSLSLPSAPNYLDFWQAPWRGKQKHLLPFSRGTHLSWMSNMRYKCCRTVARWGGPS